MIKTALEMLSMKFASLLSLRNVAPIAAGQVGSNSAFLSKKHESDQTVCNSNNSSINMHQMRSIAINNSVKQAAVAIQTRKKSAIQQIEVPPPPKKPKTPWLLFVSDRRDEYLRRNPDATATQLISSLAKEYNSSDVSKYHQMYDQLHEDYLKSRVSYEQSLTDEQRSQLEQTKESKRLNRIKKEVNKLKPPVLPRNAANLYCAEMCLKDDVKEQFKSKTSSSVFSELFAKYRTFDEQTKRKYVELQAKDRVRFKSEFNNWYEKVMNDNNVRAGVKNYIEAMHARYKLLGYI